MKPPRNILENDIVNSLSDTLTMYKLDNAQDKCIILNKILMTVRYFIKSYDDIPSTLWDEVNTCIFYGHEVIDKLTGIPNIIYKHDQERIFIVEPIVVNYKNTKIIAKGIARDRFQYKIDSNGTKSKTFHLSLNIKDYKDTEDRIAEHLILLSESRQIYKFLYNHQEGRVFKTTRLEEIMEHYKHNSYETKLDKILDFLINNNHITEIPYTNRDNKGKLEQSKTYDVVNKNIKKRKR